MAKALVKLDKHEPERRRKDVVTLNVGCAGCHGSCCCCCCLHTLGSVIGAAVAPAIGRRLPNPITYYDDEETGEPVPDIRRQGISAVAVFWWVLCALIFLGLAYGVVQTGGSSEVMVTALIILMVFPGLQLAAAAITLFVYLFWRRPDVFRQVKQLGKITLGIVLGTLAGVLVMVAIGLLMRGFH